MSPEEIAKQTVDRVIADMWKLENRDILPRVVWEGAIAEAIRAAEVTARRKALEEAAAKMDEIGALYTTSEPASAEIREACGMDAEIEHTHNAGDAIRALMDAPEEATNG